ncbi:hypothetical protein RJ639_038983 [Escallonia herrerae]|uniref:Piriformospora indica-insensitive protein 2 n=1 Tax=Escallonia herrerae TaxID=1293975 RepID=A0AA88WI91_9ASTE|nr:hypothetical protein RJ639_038983 [Escallonia herrerae]
MASALSTITLIFVSLLGGLVVSQPVLDKGEQESVYLVLESVNSEVPWRSIFPDDLCYSGPHGVVCDYFTDTNSGTETVHVTELNIGYVSDQSPNPPCTPNSTIDPLLISPFKYLRKLFFYKCFTQTNVRLPDISGFGSSLQELVFVGNPALTGSLSGNMSNMTSLRRVVLTGTGVSGKVPDGFGDLVNLEQLTLSRNRFSGEVLLDFFKLKKLKVLDLSQNGFEGNIPESVGGLTDILKLDLSFNNFSGKITESLKGLKGLEFLDLSYNKFGNFGVPLFLAEMPTLKEVHLSGNLLGGQIPQIWKNLGGLNGIGLSDTGLVGNIPASMGLSLRNVCYLGLDNNKLDGTVPEELGALELVSELNLQNNNLSGRVPFSTKFAAKVGEKLKLEGNPGLCVDEGLRSAKISGSLAQLKACSKPDIPQYVLFHGDSSTPQVSHVLMVLGFLLLLSW